MLTILLTLIALILSFLINKLLLKLLRENAVIFGAPILEEIFKTLPAYFLNRPILYVHILFGLGEAVYDFLNSDKGTARWAALSSVISHTLFGALTVWVSLMVDNIYPALASAVIAHCLWNFVIMRIGRR